MFAQKPNLLFVMNNTAQRHTAYDELVHQSSNHECKSHINLPIHHKYILLVTSIYRQIYFSPWYQRISLCPHVHVRDTFLKCGTTCATMPLNLKTFRPLELYCSDWICPTQPYCIRCIKCKVCLTVCFNIITKSFI